MLGVIINRVIAIVKQDRGDTRSTSTIVVYGAEPPYIVMAVAVARVTNADGGEFASGIIAVGDGVNGCIGCIQPEFLSWLTDKSLCQRVEMRWREGIDKTQGGQAF